jgi:hypothetical protein
VDRPSVTGAHVFICGRHKARDVTEAMAAMGSPNQVHLPGLFLKFLGVVEVLGALGLILPGIFRTRTGLTPLAALGLFIIMVGAVIITIMGDGVGAAVVPFVLRTTVRICCLRPLEIAAARLTLEVDGRAGRNNQPSGIRRRAAARV